MSRLYLRVFPLLAAFAFLAMTVPFAPAHARDNLDRGPKVGAKIPHALNVSDQTGAARDFSAIGGKRGLILLFTRSLDW